MSKDKKPTLLEIYDKVNETANSVEQLRKDFLTCSQDISKHGETLYGSQQVPETGLIMRMHALEERMSLVQKVAFALVPGTGAVWVAAEYVIRFFIRS